MDGLVEARRGGVKGLGVEQAGGQYPSPNEAAPSQSTDASSSTSGCRRNRASRAHWMARVALVVVGLGHSTHFMHIFHESHVPSQQT